MRAMDVILAFPQIMLRRSSLVATVGPKQWLIVLAVGVTTMPRVARVMRGAALEVVERDFVQAAEALGESRWRILAAEMLPNVTSPLLVEASLRLTYSDRAGRRRWRSSASASRPERADWGLMINENRPALSVQPWGVVLPVLAIALLTIGTGLVGDGLARASIGLDRGRSD